MKILEQARKKAVQEALNIESDNFSHQGELSPMHRLREDTRLWLKRVDADPLWTPGHRAKVRHCHGEIENELSKYLK